MNCHESPNLMYPDRDDFYSKHDEHVEPHIFNYFCLHRYQCFIKRSRKKFIVYSRFWSPSHFINRYEYSSGVVDYIFYEGSNIREAMSSFVSLCKELLNSHRSEYVGLGSSGQWLEGVPF